MNHDFDPRCDASTRYGRRCKRYIGPTPSACCPSHGTREDVERKRIETWRRLGFLDESGRIGDPPVSTVVL